MKYTFTSAATGRTIWEVPDGGESAWPPLAVGNKVTVKEQEYVVESIHVDLDKAPDVTVELNPDLRD